VKKNNTIRTLLVIGFVLVLVWVAYSVYQNTQTTSNKNMVVYMGPVPTGSPQQPTIPHLNVTNHANGQPLSIYRVQPARGLELQPAKGAIQ
jgi:predicted negative regulator of RcsB-dependent stress response